MKKTFFLTLILFISFIATAQAVSLKEKLESFPQIKSVTELPTDTLFSHKYLLMVEQPIDHEHPEKGTFTQRVFLSHLGYDNPVIFITEGYSASYEMNPQYIHELSYLLQGNQVTVEHRYFGESTPQTVDYNYLTVKQAATDHHQIITILKNIYPNNKWINTGISKGGQTALYHRYHYPEDVDVTVGYVCPLNFSYEDKRVYRFLEQVGSKKCRKKLMNYQKHMLKHKDIFLPMFQEASNKKGFTYPFSYEEAYELVIMEYPFAFWQWGYYSSEDIPTKQSNDSICFAHLQAVSPFDYFAEQGIDELFSFFYQAMTEIGYYGYDLKPYGSLIKTVHDHTFMFTIPPSLRKAYDYTKMEAVKMWLQSDAERMLFIYGEYDPWTATAVETGNNAHIIKIIKPEGNHRSRIRNLPTKEQQHVYDILQKWLNIEITPFVK